MVPPQGNLSAPVQTWKQEEAFDSAQACEEARRETLANLTRLVSAADHPDAPAAATKEINEKFRKEVEHFKDNARCVPAEHIYPLAQPTPPEK